MEKLNSSKLQFCEIAKYPGLQVSYGFCFILYNCKFHHSRIEVLQDYSAFFLCQFLWWEAEYHIVECYCTCIIEILSYFFILQSLTTSKMRKFQALKLSQFHKEKTCWTENWWSSGIMSNFLGEFFYVLGGKFFFNFVENIVASA